MFLKIIRRLCLTRGRKRCGLSLSILRRLRVDEVLCWPRLSLSVCLSVCPPAYLRNLRVAKYFVHATYVRGSVLLWRRCDKLCISGVMDDIIFAHNGPCDSAAPFFVVLCLWCDVALDCYVNLGFVLYYTSLYKRKSSCDVSWGARSHPLTAVKRAYNSTIKSEFLGIIHICSSRENA